MKPGDQIYVWRYRSKAGTPLPLPYQHHGIYAGDGQVIHPVTDSFGTGCQKPAAVAFHSRSPR